MDPRLLRYYGQELSYMREMGGEFAREFPKIAGRSAWKTFECADPTSSGCWKGSPSWRRASS